MTILQKEKKPFKMPHLLWIMTGIILLACLAAYVIPAGRFATNEAGEILGTEFHYLGYQTPVSPWDALMSMKTGLTSAATIMFVVMISGATINVVLDTGVMDDMMNWSVARLKDKGPNLLVIMMMVLMAYLGGFGGTDALIAVVPIGILFAKKLRLDPICALGVTTFAALVGFGTGPAQQATTQMLMGVIPYSAFFTRLIIMNFFLAVAIVMVLRYVKKIRKDPAKSLMYSEGWRPDAAVSADEENGLIKEVKMTWRKILVLIIFIAQYLIIALFPLLGGDSDLISGTVPAQGGSVHNDPYLKVNKLWTGDDDSAVRPSSIQVNVYHEEDLYKTITIYERYKWMGGTYIPYEWKDDSWWVEEADVPADYDVTVSEPNHLVFDVTNRYDAPEAVVEESSEPSKPAPEPSQPSEYIPEPSEEPAPSAEPSSEPVSEPSEPSEPTLPQTGQLWWPVPVLLVAGAVIAAVGALKASRRGRR